MVKYLKYKITNTILIIVPTVLLIYHYFYYLNYNLPYTEKYVVKYPYIWISLVVIFLICSWFFDKIKSIFFITGLACNIMLICFCFKAFVKLSDLLILVIKHPFFCLTQYYPFAYDCLYLCIISLFISLIYFIYTIFKVMIKKDINEENDLFLEWEENH